MSQTDRPGQASEAEVEALLRARFGDVRVVATPLNLVFLTEQTAFKMKRAVTFPFVDFSRPIDRRAAALREIARNRSTAPDLYRDVVAVTRASDGGLELDGAGPAVEWLVRMHRFDDRQTLDHIVARGELTGDLIGKLGEVIARYQRQAPIRDAGPWIRDLETYLDQNREAFRDRPDLFPPERVRALDQAMRQAFATLEVLLEERGRLGCVRLLHGDLHLRNIAVIDGKPVLFDALEFDDAIATGDKLYDLAFLVMDLLAVAGRSKALELMRSYLMAIVTDDALSTAIGRRTPMSGQFIAGYAALPFFIALRASIRAKVSAAAAAVNEGPARAAAMANARRYFSLAERQMRPSHPVLIAIGGLSGTGKSAAAFHVAPCIGRDPGAMVHRSDLIRKLMFRSAPFERLPPEAYARDVTALTYERLMNSVRTMLCTGYTTIADAVFARPEERAACEAVARATEVPFIGIWLDAPLEVRVRRVGQRFHDVSDADAEVAARQETYALGDLTWTRIDASGTPEETRDRVLAHLKNAGVMIAETA